MGEGSGVAMSCGVGRRHGLDLAWLWLWPAAALIQPLAWEIPYAASGTLKKKKFLGEIISKIFSDINHTNIFLGQYSKTKEIKVKINKQDLSKLISFCIAKETINNTKRQSTDWEKIFANDVINKGRNSPGTQIAHTDQYKENTNNPIKNGQKT